MTTPSSSEAPAEGDAPAKTVPVELLSSLAHALRSPLGIVREALGSLRSDFEAGMTDEHRMLGTLADRGLGRLGRLADTLSLLAALEAGGFELARTPVDLVELLRAAVASAVALEPRREVAFACELPGEPCRVLADAERLSRAVTEIAINAIRHARRSALLRLERAPGELRVTIEDDGQGVAVDRRATLFRRFAPRPARSGLGLGLSLAHDLIEAHGGHITLDESTLPPGRPGTTGARFVISLRG
jgi:signal transduction histidine kinase